ncbi:MAG: hypothetical protein HC767_11860 [Akkermansiaceae bacterium]|nr:hypothetical protein [Akkermansiaceae bacterium]
MLAGKGRKRGRSASSNKKFDTNVHVNRLVNKTLDTFADFETALRKKKASSACQCWKLLEVVVVEEENGS